MKLFVIRFLLILNATIISIAVYAQCDNLKAPIAHDTSICEYSYPYPFITAKAQGTGQIGWSDSEVFDPHFITLSNYHGIDCVLGKTIYYAAEYDIVNGCFGPATAITVTVMKNPTFSIISNYPDPDTVYLHSVHIYNVDADRSDYSYKWEVSGKNIFEELNNSTQCKITWMDNSEMNNHIFMFNEQYIALDTIIVKATLGNCSSDDSVIVKIMTPTYSPLLYESSLQVSPNPTTNKFTVHIDDNPQNTTIDIYNWLGLEIESRIASQTIEEFDISQFPDGIYTVIIRHGINVKKGCVIKIH